MQGLTDTPSKSISCGVSAIISRLASSVGNGAPEKTLKVAAHAVAIVPPASIPHGTKVSHRDPRPSGLTARGLGHPSAASAVLRRCRHQDCTVPGGASSSSGAKPPLQAFPSQQSRSSSFVQRGRCRGFPRPGPAPRESARTSQLVRQRDAVAGLLSGGVDPVHLRPSGASSPAPVLTGALASVLTPDRAHRASGPGIPCTNRHPCLQAVPGPRAAEPPPALVGCRWGRRRR